MRRLLIPLLLVALCCGLPGTMVVFGQNAPVPAQNPPAPGQDDPSDPPVDHFIYPNTPVTDILSIYETMTGKILIRDANMTGANISIIVNKKIPRSEAIKVIEATL